jgi:hypothetical protein
MLDASQANGNGERQRLYRLEVFQSLPAKASNTPKRRSKMDNTDQWLAVHDLAHSGRVSGKKTPLDWDGEIYWEGDLSSLAAAPILHHARFRAGKNVLGRWGLTLVRSLLCSNCPAQAEEFPHLRIY